MAAAVRRIKDSQHQQNQLLWEAARQLARKLAQRPEVSRVILFGSVAANSADALSDIDLAVVANVPEHLPPGERSRAMLTSITADHDVDIIVYTPNEFSLLAREPGPVRREIVEKGVVLFERH